MIRTPDIIDALIVNQAHDQIREAVRLLEDSHELARAQRIRDNLLQRTGGEIEPYQEEGDESSRD